MKTLRLSLTCFLLLSCPLWAATYSLDADGTGDFSTIQAAIDSAAWGDRIQLQPGVYRGPGNRDLDFGGKEVWLMGATSNPDDVVIDLEGSPSEPHRLGVYDVEGAQVWVHSITVRGGYQIEGGALYIDNQNYGPMYCVFEDNHAIRGGAIFVKGNDEFQSLSCTFRNNSASAGGGAVYSQDVAVGTFYFDNFQGNTADMGSTIYYDVGSADDLGWSFRETTVTGNSAAVDGGVAYANGPCTIHSLDSLFSGNNGGAGSVIAVPDGLASLNVSTFRGNVSGSESSCVSAGTFKANLLLITDTTGGSAVTASAAEVAGSNFWNNMGGDWTGALLPLLHQDGNLMLDPCYCSLEISDFGLCASSPCLLDLPSAFIGGVGIAGCVDCECGGVATEKMSMGGAKSMYR